MSWSLTAAVAFFICAQLTVAVSINAWNRYFFDALERRDHSAAWSVAAWLPPIVVMAALMLTGLLLSRMTLQLRWREFITGQLTSSWIGDQRYYRMQFSAPQLPAPEYRIAEDGRLSVEPLVEFAIGLITAATSAITFAAILWHVAGSATFHLGSTEFVIPSYMAFAAVGYAAATSYAAYLTGWPLVQRIIAKNEAEARFRAEMTRLRENAESIALIRGDEDERRSVMDNYGRVISAWIGVIKQQGIVALVLNANSALFPIVPLLLIAPKYLSGAVTLGAVMQIVAAFMAVQAALIWFVDNLIRLAEWFASVARVEELQAALDGIDRRVEDVASRIELRVSSASTIYWERLRIDLADGSPLIAENSFRIQSGDKVLIVGESGSGKSTLIRALAGLWPWGSGVIAVPHSAHISFLPQEPYLPLGTLRDVIVYPRENLKTTNTEVASALARVGLGYMAHRLDEEYRWDQTLSGGERQRVAFARLMLHRPSVIVMDEATSALDEESQASILALFREEIFQAATVISVGHRPSLDAFHLRKITVTKADGGAVLTDTLI
nr:ABC transporter ATP-binding protein/permease [Variibacter gotjawalensis]